LQSRHLIEQGILPSYCFEPNPEIFERLVENIELNAIKNLQCHQLALGNENSIASFQVNLDGNLGNSGYVSDTPVQFSPRTPKSSIFRSKRAMITLDSLESRRFI